MQAACGLSKTLKGWATSFLTSTDLRAAPWATQVPSSAKDEGNLPEAQQDLAGHRCPEHPVYEKKGANGRGAHRSSCAHFSPPSHKMWEHGVGVPQAEHRQGVRLQQGTPYGIVA